MLEIKMRIFSATTPFMLEAVKFLVARYNPSNSSNYRNRISYQLISQSYTVEDNLKIIFLFVVLLEARN
jgi:hypothetical protein